MPASGLSSRMARASASTALAPARSPRAARTGASASNPTRVGQGLKPGNRRRAEKSALQLLLGLLQLPVSCERTSERDGRQSGLGDTLRPKPSTSARASRASDSASSRCPSSVATNDRKESSDHPHKGWPPSVSRRPSSSALRACTTFPEKYQLIPSPSAPARPAGRFYRAPAQRRAGPPRPCPRCRRSRRWPGGWPRPTPPRRFRREAGLRKGCSRRASGISALSSRRPPRAQIHAFTRASAASWVIISSGNDSSHRCTVAIWPATTYPYQWRAISSPTRS